jgi:uncharacterized protein YukE
MANRFTVSKEAIELEAAVWEKQVPQLNELVSTLGQMQTLSSFSDAVQDAGTDLTGEQLFGAVVAAHEAVVKLATSRCTDGAIVMGKIAKTLRDVGQVYEERDREEEQRMRNLRTPPLDPRRRP